MKKESEIEVGDLVRVRSADWRQKPYGIVTDVRLLTIESTGDQYTAITALIDDQRVTYGSTDFELINKAERNTN
jgi:hypothetical protein